MISPSSAPRIGRLWTWAVLVLVLVVVIAGYVGWSWLGRTPTPPPADMVEVLHLNNQGVGYAECFQWAKAVDVFTDVVQRAPDWLPGRINLGIARHRSRRLSKLTSLWIAPAKLIGLLLTPIIRILCGLALITFTRSGQCTIRGKRN